MLGRDDFVGDGMRLRMDAVIVNSKFPPNSTRQLPQNAVSQLVSLPIRTFSCLYRRAQRPHNTVIHNARYEKTREVVFFETVFTSILCLATM